ncbi:MAG TPA: ABC transporter permease [Candidatus Polarisedimenticolia bacterium]|nr:ABC transporter permease [Candidatus Polarisedimenticolia bacterium]
MNGVLDGVLQDLRAGLRVLRTAPALALGVIAAFALGIGANTSIYSIVNAVLLRALPYSEPERLMEVALRRDGFLDDRSVLSVADALTFAEATRVFERHAVYTAQGMALSGGGTPEQVRGSQVTTEFFDTLGTQAALGRTFDARDGAAGALETVVLGHALWQRRFAGSPAVVGQHIVVDGRSREVIGVLPPGFDFPYRQASDLYAVLRLEPSNVRAPFYLSAVARTRPGATEAQVAADLASVTTVIKERYPDSPKDWTMIATPLKETLVSGLRPALLLLLGAVSVVLLIASANIAGLLLARAAGRRREMAVRAALGAGAGRLASLALSEALVLATLGGLGGAFLSVWGTDLLVAWAPADLPRLGEVRLDPGVLAYTLGVTLVCGLLAGLAPALQARGFDLMASLRDSARTTADRAGVRLRRALVVGEFAVAVTLLGGAALLLHSFLKLQRVDPGFDTGRLVTMRLSLPDVRYGDGAKRAAFYRDLVAQAATLPGVRSAAVSMAVPPDQLQMTNPFTVEGRPIPKDRSAPLAAQLLISPGYFATLGAPILAGRVFTSADREGTTPVILINQAMARQVFPGEDPIGRRLALGGPTDHPQWVTIVGVVGDVRYSGLDQPVGPTMYTPYEQDNWWPSMFLILKTEGDLAGTAAGVRHVVAGLDAELPVYAVSRMDQLLDRSVAQPRFRTTLIGLFAATAVLLAGLGAYGLLSYAVRQRTREMGIRLALGAQSRDVLGLVMRDGMRLACVGSIVGLAGALVLGRFLSGMLYGIGPSDPATYLSVTGLILAVAVVACFIPARRATRVQPVVALRSE